MIYDFQCQQCFVRFLLAEPRRTVRQAWLERREQTYKDSEEVKNEVLKQWTNRHSS